VTDRLTDRHGTSASWSRQSWSADGFQGGRCVYRLTYAASAWFGFITSADKQRIEAFFRRSKRSGNCSTDLPDFVQLVEEGDERLFRRINNNSSHVLRELLPPPPKASQQYNLRTAASPRRPHDRQVPDHTGHLADKNFLTRMLFKDSASWSRTDFSML